MPTSYTSLLGLALPVTGELAGTWGDTVNNYITSYLDSSVAGTQTISGSQTAVTLSVTNGTTLTQVGSGATGSAQYNIINCTGNPASLLTITAPAASKTYLIINATSTNQSVKIVGTGPTTGVTLIAGEKALVAWNGSDFIKVATTAAAAGSNTQVQYNSGGNLAGSANLTFDGTNLTLSGGTANGIAYLNGSKVLTTGSALTFDGAGVLTVGNDSVATVFNAPGDVAQYVVDSNGTGAAASHQWRHGSTEQMRLTSTGLGIGTSSPGAKFVVSNAGAAGLEINPTGGVGGGATISTYNRGTSAYTSLTTYSSTMTWYANGSTRAMDLDSSGNLGIGTSSPVTKLNIASAAGSPTSVSVGAIRVYETTNNYGLNIGGDGTYGYIQGLRGATSTLGFNDLVLQPNGGNLGLGVTPSAWSGNYKAIQSGNSGAFAGFVGNDQTFVVSNAYNDGSWKYKNSAGAGYYAIQGVGNGVHAWYTAPSGTAGNAISFTQAMTLDASGNLVLGTTAVAAAEGYRFYKNYGRYDNGTFTGFIGGGTSLGSAAASDFAFRSENALAFLTGGATERARITSGGNLLVGTTTATGARIDSQGSVAGALEVFNGQNTSADVAAITRLTLASQGGNWYIENQRTGAPLCFNNGTERARITSGGDLLVGTSSGQVAATVVAYRASAATACVGPWNAATTGDNLFVVFNTEATATLRGSIDYNRAGGLTRYNITSDYRAKDIIGPAQNTGATIDALKVYEGMMKGATQTRPMMIAHEAQAVVPFCVSGTKDEINEDGTPKYQQMDHASLVPLLIAEIQSLRARVAQLEAK